MKLRRFIDGKLADGRGSQLFMVLGLIVLSFGIFWGISTLCFEDSAFTWQDIIALYLDPGVFGGKQEHDWFRLMVTISGIILVAATLISVFSNIFENISVGYRKGELRYNFKEHILIIGANKLLIGLLENIKEAQCESSSKTGRKTTKKKYGSKPIVIMTTSHIEKLRDEIEAYFNDKTFTRRITFYFDKRDNLENLKRSGVTKSSFIYVLGEDNEPDHDVVNLLCVKLIRDLLKGVKDSSGKECLAIMDSQTTMKAYQEYLSIDKADKFKIEYKENIVNLNECQAELALKNTFVSKIKALNNSDTMDINIVIFGMTALGRALATTIAYSCHFKDKRRTRIIFIDEAIEQKSYEFQSRYHTYFKYCKCHYTNNINDSKEELFESKWCFIDSVPSSPDVIDYLRTLNSDSHLYLYVCYDDIQKNIATEVSLRNVLDGLSLFSDFGKYADAFSMYTTDGLSFKGIFHAKDRNDIDYLYNYIFNIRHEAAKSLYESEHAGDWSALSFSNKQRRLYESVIHNWWGKNELCDWRQCYNDITYIAVYGENGDQFMRFTEQIIGNTYRLATKEDFEKTQLNIMEYLNEDIEGDLANYLRLVGNCIFFDSRYDAWASFLKGKKEEIIISDNDCIVDEEVIDISVYEEEYKLSDYMFNAYPLRLPLSILSDQFMNAILRYAMRRPLSDACIIELIKLWLLNFSYDEEDKSHSIKHIAYEILKHYANDGNPHALLALCYYKFSTCEHIEESNSYINLFNSVVESTNNTLPIWFLFFINQLPDERWQSLYNITQNRELFDFKILMILTYSGSDLDIHNMLEKTQICEGFVKRLYFYNSEGEVYIRLAEVIGLDKVYVRAWLTKAKNYYINILKAENKDHLCNSDLIPIYDKILHISEMFITYYNETVQNKKLASLYKTIHSAVLDIRYSCQETRDGVKVDSYDCLLGILNDDYSIAETLAYQKEWLDAHRNKDPDPCHGSYLVTNKEEVIKEWNNIFSDIPSLQD